MSNPTASNPVKVLCVDDDPHILASLRRQLHRGYDVTTVASGQDGLRALRELGPFAVIVADLRMPGMDGIAFFERAQSVSPSTVRILLTGQADLEAAIEAINEGHIFRFLRKPCPPLVLLKSVRAAAEQYALIHAERVLLAETLLGCVRVLSDVLALTNPAAFGRALRVQEYVGQVADDFNLSNRWELEIPALLSQIGWITLPSETVDKIHQSEELSDSEQEMVEHLPQVTAELLGNIPRLESVHRILSYQDKLYSGEGRPVDDVRGEKIPFGSRVLRIALDYDSLEMRGMSAAEAIETMNSREGWYDPDILHRFAMRRGQSIPHLRIKKVDLSHLEPEMVFDEDVRTSKGVFLIPRGQRVTSGLIRRLRNLSPTAGLQSSFTVRITTEEGIEA